METSRAGLLNHNLCENTAVLYLHSPKVTSTYVYEHLMRGYYILGIDLLILLNLINLNSPMELVTTVLDITDPEGSKRWMKITSCVHF